MHKSSVIDELVTIEHAPLHAATGGLVGAGNLRNQAKVLDAVAPNTVGVQVGPVSASWNVPDRPFTKLLDAGGYPAQPPAPPQQQQQARPWWSAFAGTAA